MVIILTLNSQSLRLCLGNCRMSLVEGGELCLGGDTDISVCSSNVCSTIVLYSWECWCTVCSHSTGSAHSSGSG